MGNSRETFIQHLMEIEKRCGLYIGRKSMHRLDMYLCGFAGAILVSRPEGWRDGSWHAWLDDFQNRFIPGKFGERHFVGDVPVSSRRCSTILTERAGSDEAAFDLFFELLHEYLVCEE